MPVKPIANWTVFGKIQTATTTFIARLTRFRLISRPLENPHRIPTGRRGFITVPVPVGISTTHGSRVNAEPRCDCRPGCRGGRRRGGCRCGGGRGARACRCVRTSVGTRRNGEPSRRHHQRPATSRRCRVRSTPPPPPRTTARRPATRVDAPRQNAHLPLPVRPLPVRRSSTPGCGRSVAAEYRRRARSSRQRHWTPGRRLRASSTSRAARRRRLQRSRRQPRLTVVR